MVEIKATWYPFKKKWLLIKKKTKEANPMSSDLVVLEGGSINTQLRVSHVSCTKLVTRGKYVSYNSAIEFVFKHT